MGFISSAAYFFTPYADGRERTVARFFKKATERDDPTNLRARLDHLLQRDVAVINLWTEYRYKGYKYLRKSQRRKLYANLQLIADDFDRFYAGHAQDAETVVSHIRRLAPSAAVDPKKAILLQALIDYFSPHRGVYEYRDSSSFGRLLRDPAREKLVGDCNQIVTLYMYLYARYFDVRDLWLRSLPGHVALHYAGIDIETTNGTFMNYAEKEGSLLLPVEEIVSINLLDLTDSYLSTHEVAAEDLLQASRLAFILSHNRELVTRNLHAAYTRMVSSLMKRNNFGRALDFALSSHDTSLLGAVGHNGAIYEMGRHQYAAARRLAQYAPGREALLRNIWQTEGANNYQAHRYREAIKAFEHIGEQGLVRQCYEALYFEEQKKLGQNPTVESLKKNAGTIKHLRAYAQKSGNKKLIAYADSLSKYL